MKRFLLLTILVFSTLQLTAQDKKWSVETNYTVIPSDGFGGDNNILDFGLKYRFADLEFLQLGVGTNVGFASDNFNDIESVEGKYKGLYVQPRVFAEFIIPGIQKLRPSIALGYSIVKDDTDVISAGEEIKINTTNGGFNLNLGVSYDITKTFFIQVQYDFINLNVRDEFEFQGQEVQNDYNNGLSNLRLGIGFRF